jgi:hypothetical protein
MGVNHNTGDVKGVSKNYIGGLATDPRELDQHAEIHGDFSGESLLQLAAASLDVLGLVTVETG